MNFRLAKRDEVYKTEKNIGKHLTIGKTMIPWTIIFERSNILQKLLNFITTKLSDFIF